jgi:hypothetical protein
MQDHHRQVDPLSVARTCALAVETKGSNGHYHPLVEWEEVRPRVTEAGALPAFPCRLILLWGRSEAYKIRAIHNAASELRRIPLPRTRVNKAVRCTLRGVEQHRFACAGN